MKLAWYKIELVDGALEPRSCAECPMPSHSIPAGFRERYEPREGQSFVPVTNFYVQAFGVLDALERWKKAGE